MKTFEVARLPPGLYLVATPIGNLRDITLRAMDVLASADLVVCEDTRVTGKLLHVFGIDKTMLSYNDYNAGSRRGQIIEKLSAGGSIALVSDAGTPLISDPGFKLVRDCLDLGIFVTSVPGASAPLSALQLSGLPSDKFSFLGFLPPKKQARRAAMKEWAAVPGTLIAFETGPRLVESLADMLAVWGDRPAAVVREMTKLYEESRRGTLAGLHAFYAESGAPKGEIVVAVGAAAPGVLSEEEVNAMLSEALKTLGMKEASSLVAGKTGMSRKKLYEMALAMQKRDEE